MFPSIAMLHQLFNLGTQFVSFKYCYSTQIIELVSSRLFLNIYVLKQFYSTQS